MANELDRKDPEHQHPLAKMLLQGLLTWHVKPTGDV
jgi:hypothetical protein